MSRRQTDDQIRGRTGEVQGAVALRIEVVAARGENREMLFPRCDGIRPIEAAQPLDRRPQPRALLVARHVGKHFGRPRVVGRRDDAPVRVVARDLLPERHDGARHRLLHRADEIRRLILQQIGIVRVDREHRAADGDVIGEHVRQPA